MKQTCRAMQAARPGMLELVLRVGTLGNAWVRMMVAWDEIEPPGYRIQSEEPGQQKLSNGSLDNIVKRTNS